MSVVVFTDFDGTITMEDTLVHLLDHYVGSSWLEIEDRVDDGSLSEELGLQQEIALLRAPWEEARDLVLGRVPIDPRFHRFVALCGANGWELEILSGGLEPLIRAVLEREGLGELTLRANGLAFEEDGQWRAIPAASPRINKRCNHCKTHWLSLAAGAGKRTLYIGDGGTDRCPGPQADLLFAKGNLATWCEERGVDHVPVDGFGAILDWLEGKQGKAWIGGGA